MHMSTCMSGAAHASRLMCQFSIATRYSISRHAHEHPCRRAQPHLSSPWRIRDEEGERPLNSCLPASFFLCLLTCMPPPTATLLCSELHFCLWAGSFFAFGRVRGSSSRPSSSSSTRPLRFNRWKVDSPLAEADGGGSGGGAAAGAAAAEQQRRQQQSNSSSNRTVVSSFWRQRWPRATMLSLPQAARCA